MPWLPNGDAKCDSCPATYAGLPGLAETVQRIVAAGWGFWEGPTGGGNSVRYIACRACRREEHKRPRTKATIEDQPFPGLE